MEFVSIIVLTKNRKNMLLKCLKSLCTQEYRSYEIIVVDDNSIDGTKNTLKRICNKYKNIQFVQRDREGLASGRNFGIKLSKGEIIGFIDDDCEAHHQWLSRAMKIYENCAVDVIRGAAILPDGTFFSSLNPEGLHFPTLNIFYKKSIFEEIGMFDERFVYGAEDRDMGIRALKAGYKMVTDPNVIVYHPFKYDTISGRIKRLWNISRHRSTNRVLLFKKHLEYRSKLFLKIFAERGHIAVLTFFIAILIITVNIKYFEINALNYTAIIMFLIIYYFVYFSGIKNIKKLIKRIFTSGIEFVFDFILTIYTIKGSIKYKIFII